MFRRSVGRIIFSSQNEMRTYRVENGRGQAGSSHQLKAQSATALLRVHSTFLERLPLVGASTLLSSPARNLEKSAADERVRGDSTGRSHWYTDTIIAQFNKSASNLATLGNPHYLTIAAVNFRFSARRVPLMSTDPRPGHVLKAALASGILAERVCQGDKGASNVINTPCTALQKRQEYPGAVSWRWCLPARAWMRGFSRFIGVYCAWLAADELRATGMQLNARRRWRGKKHVPDSQNRGAVTRRCCGARRPIDHQSLPSRMRRSLPHDFGVPTPKARSLHRIHHLPSVGVVPALSPTAPLAVSVPHSFLPPFSLFLSPSLRARAELTRQLPCLRATLPLTRLLGQDQRSA